MPELCGAISRQGSVCNQEKDHEQGCHEDTRTEGRWWGDVRDDPADLAWLLKDRKMLAERVGLKLSNE